MDRSDALAWQFRVSEMEDKDEGEAYFEQVGVCAIVCLCLRVCVCVCLCLRVCVCICLDRS